VSRVDERQRDPWPERSGATDECVFPGFILRAQYEADDEHLARINIGR
jgi:hypothetical protein